MPEHKMQVIGGVRYRPEDVPEGQEPDKPKRRRSTPTKSSGQPGGTPSDPGGQGDGAAGDDGDDGGQGDGSAQS